jgi:soluble lytic murein transglycosylase-like protein
VKRGLLLLLAILWCVVPVAAQKCSFPSSYDDAFRKYSKRFFGVGYDWRIFKAQALAESNLSPTARSWVGAKGIMQLMPATFAEVQSKNPEFSSISDPVWNIAAGIAYNRMLWKLLEEQNEEKERSNFMFGSYNAGRGTILKAKEIAEADSLDPKVWQNIEPIAPKVPHWRYSETFGYVRKIDSLYAILTVLSGAKPLKGK